MLRSGRIRANSHLQRVTVSDGNLPGVLRSVRDGEPPPGPPGRYEVRVETRVGVQVTAVYWLAPGEPPSLIFVLAHDRVPLLAEALAAYLGGSTPPGP